MIREIRSMNFFCRCFLSGTLLTSLIAVPGCGDNRPKQEKKTEKTEKSVPAPKKKSPVRKTFADSEEGSLKVRFSNNETERMKPEVRDNSRNVNLLNPDDPATAGQQEKISKKELLLRKSFRSPCPDGSFAARLKPLNSGKIIRWSPERRSEMAGEVRLPAIAVSPDRTVIIIAETLGESRGPYGTRLIFLDTTSWTITAVHHLWKKDIRFIAVSPDHVPVLAARGQEAFKSGDEIILLDPWSGKAKQILPLPGVRELHISADNRLFAVFARDSEQSQRIRIFDSLLKTGDPKAKEIKSANRSPKIAFSSDGTRIFLAGDQTVEIWKSSDLRLLESFPLPNGFVTADLLAMPDNTVLIAPESIQQRPAVALRNGRIIEFGEKSRGMLLPLPAARGQFFGAVMNRRGRISKIALSTLQEQSGVDPEEGRPRTSGDPMAVFAFAKIPATAVLDEKGCFYLLYRDPSGKRWRKEILFQATASQ